MKWHDVAAARESRTVLMCSLSGPELRTLLGQSLHTWLTNDRPRGREAQSQLHLHAEEWLITAQCDVKSQNGLLNSQECS